MLWFGSDASFLASVLQVRPDCPVALIQNNADKDGDDAMKVIPCEHQLPQQRKQVWHTPLTKISGGREEGKHAKPWNTHGPPELSTPVA